MDIFVCLKNNSLKVNLNGDNGRFKLELLDLSVKEYKCVLFFLCISGANIYANTGYKQEKGTNKFSDSVAIYSQKKKVMCS